MNNFATNLTYYRKLAGLNQNQLADKIGITPAQISRYERNMAEPRADVLAKIASVLEIKIEDLIPVPKIKEVPYIQMGNVISKRMKELGIGVFRLSRSLELPDDLIRKTMTGELKPKLPVLKKILDYLCIPVDEIIDSRDDNIPNTLSGERVKLLIDFDSNGNSVTFSESVAIDDEPDLIDGMKTLIKNYIARNHESMPSISNIDEFDLQGISINFQKK